MKMTMSLRHGALSTFAIAFMACASQPTTVKPAAERKTVVIELYGTKQVTLDHLVSRYEKELRWLCQAKPIEPPTLRADLEALGDFADIEFGAGSYYDAPDKCFITVDFVDRADAARRMPFGPEPKGVYEDPEGLLAGWRAYESKVFELMGAGQMSARRVACPAFHCFGDHSHPAVKQLAATFVERVPAHVEELAAILRDDRSSSHRADAAFLLAYSSDGPGLVKRMISASRDPEGIVRNNAMRVLSDIAFHHPELDPNRPYTGGPRVPNNPRSQQGRRNTRWSARTTRRGAPASSDRRARRPDAAGHAPAPATEQPQFRLPHLEGHQRPGLRRA
jgi:hypothetical protein